QAILKNRPRSELMTTPTHLCFRPGATCTRGTARSYRVLFRDSPLLGGENCPNCPKLSTPKKPALSVSSDSPDSSDSFPSYCITRAPAGVRARETFRENCPNCPEKGLRH